MSRFLTVLCGSMLLPTTLAMGLPAPTQDQFLTGWDYQWEIADYDGDLVDDDVNGADFTGNLFPDLVGDCAIDYPNPTGQPKVPEGCGTFSTEDGGEGFYIFYDPTGLAPGNFWYNRLLVRYTHANVVYRGKYRVNEAHPECLTADACGGRFKFCGDMRYTAGSTFSGDFNWCSFNTP